MIKKIIPKAFTVKANSYSSKPKKSLTRLDTKLNSFGTHESVKRKITVLHELTDLEIMYQTDDKRQKFRQVIGNTVNGYINAYILVFNEPSRYIIMTEIEETTNAKGITSRKAINSLRFNLMNHKVIKAIEPSFDVLYTAIIKNNAVIGLYPAEVTEDWDKGIDLLDEFRKYDFGMFPEPQRPNTNKVALTISEKKKQIQDRTVFDDNPRKGII